MAALRRTDPAAPIPTQEAYGKAVDFPDLWGPTVSYGLPFDEAIVKHIATDAKVYVLASPSLCAKTDALDRLKAALGVRFKGVRMGMTPHTLLDECIEAFGAAQAVHADTIVTLGAGSLADAAKLVCAMTANDMGTAESLGRYEIRRADGATIIPDIVAHTQTLIMIPTSLSGGEHTPYAGVTIRATRRKVQVPTGGAAVTILDPWLCLATPNSLWLQSGVRGIDHGVEHAVSSRSRPEAVETCAKGLRLLVPGLLACARDPNGTDAVARLNAQLGVALTITPLMWGCYPGASHGIGHMLGPMGVGHGETSCVLLPAVCRYNHSVNGTMQGVVAQALWEDPTCMALFVSKSLARDTAELADLLDIIIRELGMPRTLRDVGVVGESKLRTLAENSMYDFCVAVNPRPVTVDGIMDILRAVEG